ncbi:PepSY-like domain-containing protein [Brachyspira pulli]|uniref:PepSY-like domain-containing protein n=1 Tax=Brachyspira pulli TaxID=310721 RepID=UPI0030074612
MDILSSKSLPQKARNFIETYFSDYYLFKVTFNSSYSAVFKGGSSINFNTKGEWTSIIGNGNEIPLNIVEKIAEDNIIEKDVLKTIKEKYESINIYRIIKRKNKYEMLINNNIITIDIEGNILKIKSE